MASKIIILGSIDGQVPSIFEKISKLQSKTPFSFAIVAGDLFADPSNSTAEHEETITALLNSRINIPLPVYFTLGKHALPPRIIERLDSANNEVCSNLYFLGKRSTTKTSEGIRIVTLGGSLDSGIAAGLSKDKYLPFHTEGDAKSLHGTNSADILITSSWPAAVRTRSKVPLPEGTAEPEEEQCVAELCAALRPRYHFSVTAHGFYEREPFFHEPTESSTDVRPITRFLSLASPNSTTKAKWLYAFSLDPTSSQPVTLPTGSTPSPFAITKKRPHPSSSEQEPYSRYSNHNSHHSSRPLKRRRNNKAPPGPDECFFCLSNPTLSTHLITSIATDTYLTTAKGPLTLSTTYPGLNAPSHVLLIPLTHSPTLASITPSETRSSTYSELQRYRSALQSMLASVSNNGLGAVTWEVSRDQIRHFHWQFLPVRRELVEKGLVEAAFRVEAENEQYPSFHTRDIGEGEGEGEYFRVWIWSPGSGVSHNKPRSVSNSESESGSDSDSDSDSEARTTDRTTVTTNRGVTIPKFPSPLASVSGSETNLTLTLPLPPDLRFDIQFGRRVMGKLLGLEDRLDWRACMQDEEEEKRDVEAFKKAFEKWDWAREE